MMRPISITDVRIPISSLAGNPVETNPVETNPVETEGKPSLLPSNKPHASTVPFCKLNLHISSANISALNQETPAASADVLAGDGCFALPGFIDLHAHGGMGADTMDATPQALAQMARFFAQHGVTAFCPTTMTAPHEHILQALKNVATAASIQTSVLGAKISGARVLGVHVEGPYISPLFPGAQPAEYVRPPHLGEFQALLQSGPVSLITLAPEVSGASALIELARQNEVVIVIGHTNASYEDCLAAVESGATQATHTYNAMSGLHHRNPGTLGAVLSHDGIDAQLIADNIHVHPAAMKILSRAKGPDRTILITDAMRAAGLPEGEYTLGEQRVTVKDGACRLADGTLAGSILTMDQALINFMDATGLSLDEAWPTTSRTAARTLGLHNRLGSIGVGYMADLVLLDQNYQVVATIVDGEIVYLRDPERFSSNHGTILSS